MTTDRYLYAGHSLTLGVDGRRPVGQLEGDECCPDPLCIPLCDTACSFVDLLPTGPMWDRPKEVIKLKLSGGGDLDPCAPLPDCAPEEDCPSIAYYAMYGARVMTDMVTTILWPAVRESNPFTAVNSLDDWLDRLGWEDCYRQHCRSVYASELSPFEREGRCGPFFCDPAYPRDLECALKYGIVRALVRLQRGIIKNLDGINWVIAPLGAEINPRRPYPYDVRRFLEGECGEEVAEEGPPCFCEDVELEICAVGDTIPGCPSLSSQCGGDPPAPVNNAFYYQCGNDETETIIYPGVIAAECIVRSILVRKCPNIVFRCE